MEPIEQLEDAESMTFYAPWSVIGDTSTIKGQNSHKFVFAQNSARIEAPIRSL